MSLMMRTSLEAVPKPEAVLPEHEDEVFVQLGFHDQTGLVMAFTLPVSTLLNMLNGLVADLHEIVQNDVREEFPFRFNPN